MVLLQVYFTLVLMQICSNIATLLELIISDKIHHVIIDDIMECMAYHHLNAVKPSACISNNEIIQQNMC